jgi:hypothetical protein
MRLREKGVGAELVATNYSAFSTLVNIAVSLVPTPLVKVIMASAMPEAIRAYSIAVVAYALGHQVLEGRESRRFLRTAKVEQLAHSIRQLHRNRGRGLIRLG